MDDLSTFLLARLDEWEAKAKAGTIHTRGCPAWLNGGECDCVGKLVLADIAAKRKLIEPPGDSLFCQCEQWGVSVPHDYSCTAYQIGEVLALAFAGHPDYREQWRPVKGGG